MLPLPSWQVLNYLDEGCCDVCWFSQCDLVLALGSDELFRNSTDIFSFTFDWKRSLSLYISILILYNIKSWLLQIIVETHSIFFALIIRKNDWNVLAIRHKILHNSVNDDLLLLQDKILLGPVCLDKSVNDLNLSPWFFHDLVDRFNRFFFLLVNVSVKVADKAFLFITVKLSQKKSIVTHSDNFK